MKCKEDCKKKEEDKMHKLEKQENVLNKTMKEVSEAVMVSPIKLFHSTRTNSGNKDSINHLLQSSGAIMEIDIDEANARMRSEMDPTQRSPPQDECKVLGSGNKL